MRRGALVCQRRKDNGYRFGFKVDGGFKQADGVSVEGTEGDVEGHIEAAQRDTVLYVASARICGDDQNHSSNGRHPCGVLGPQVLHEESDVFHAGGHSIGAIIRYVEVKHGLCINIRSLRRRMEAQRERKHPRAIHTA